jgi:hypothetical protein
MPISKEKPLTLRWPSGGLNRRNPFVGNRMYTTYDCLNVWLDDPTREQERGGSRPGLVNLFGTSGTDKIRAITNVGWKAAGVNHRGLVWVVGNNIKIEDNGTVNTIGNSIKEHGRTTIAELNQKAYISQNTSGNIVVADPSTMGASNLTASKGTIPLNCNVVASWRGRLVLADGDDPSQIFFSRIGDPTDWDYTAKDNASAVMLSTSHAGITPQPVRALIPNTDDCMIIGCDQSIWVMRGDPKTGGTVENLSDEIGILDSKAWCKTPDSSLVVMTQDGVYWMPPGCGSPFTSVSREVMPKELRGLDRTKYAVSMCYDQPSRMIFLFVSKEARLPSDDTPDPPPGASYFNVDPSTIGSIPPDGGELLTNHFAIDIRIERNGDVTHPRSASFYPMDMASGSEPFACTSRYKEGGQPYAVLGTRAGQVKHFEWGREIDDDIDFESYIVYGPFAQNDFQDMMLKRVEVTLGRSSNPITLEAWACDDAEDIETFDIDSPPFSITIDNQIRNFKHDIRLRGRCFYIILRSIDKRLWSIDKINCQIAGLGRSRIHRDPEATSTGPDPMP